MVQDNQSTETQRESFVIRVWREGEDQSLWRGQIQHVRTGEVISFKDLSAMFKYIRETIKADDLIIEDRGLR